MSLPVVNLDDRNFDQLAAEARLRLQQALPELAGLAPGDPLYYLVDCFAHLTDQLIHRANLIPERQRNVFLNLTALPRRAAGPARGLVSLDLDGQISLEPKPIPAETALKAGKLPFVTEQEVLATPLELRVMQKRAAQADAAALAELYPEYEPGEIRTFAPRELVPGSDLLDSGAGIDGYLYLALCVAKPLSRPGQLTRIRRELAGRIVNIGLVPERGLEQEAYGRPLPRRLDWHIAWCREQAGGRPACSWLPLNLHSDETNGARSAGVVRLQLPEDQDLLMPVLPADPADAGIGDAPPALPADLSPAQLICWLRLGLPGDHLRLAHIAVNAVRVSGQGVERDLMLGVGSGESGQRLRLGQPDVDPASLRLEVSQDQAFHPWRQVPHFGAGGPTDRIYRFDPATGLVVFGDGVNGLRPPRGARIRAAVLRYGGGSAGNLPAGSIKTLATPVVGGKPRHETPTLGGRDAESVSQAERRIAAVLRHRNRAVTAGDFVELTLSNPVNPVARAELLPGFHPGREFADARDGVPGVVSLLVLPPAGDDGALPRPTAGLLADVHGYLSERMLIGTELYVLSPQFIPLGISVSCDAVEPDRALGVEQAVEQALADYLWPLTPGGLAGNGWQFGRAVEAGELYTAVARVPGVRAIHGIQLQQPGASGWQPAAGNRIELPRFGLPQPLAIGVSANGPGSEPDLNAALAPAAEAAPLTPIPVFPGTC
jgi:hypothetical protein